MDCQTLGRWMMLETSHGGLLYGSFPRESGLDEKDYTMHSAADYFRDQGRLEHTCGRQQRSGMARCPTPVRSRTSARDPARRSRRLAALRPGTSGSA